MDHEIAAERLRIAHQIVNRLWQDAPRHQHVGPPDYDYARSWPWIPTGYQLVEQAFKLLLAIHWCVPPVNVRNRLERGLRHDLDALFGQLPTDDKAAVESAYGSFVDLHRYIPVKTASHFLQSVGHGYANWRYVLLEGWTDSRGEPDPRRAPPTNHIGVLIEIAAVAIARAKSHVNGKPRRFPSVVERVDHELDNVVGHWCNRLHDGGSKREDWDKRHKNLHQLLVEHRHAIAAQLDNTDNPKLGPRLSSNPYLRSHLPELPEELLPIVAELRRSRDRKNLFVYFCKA
ncbi:MAG: hypothetical protein OYL92_17050 [Acidobacteriota bacterium]|nr:hypothetical protein [Acidobacteriota bacterium]MDE3266675.1 hypothetical protein [Acidobacteriota bacterium]